MGKFYSKFSKKEDSLYQRRIVLENTDLKKQINVLNSLIRRLETRIKSVPFKSRDSDTNKKENKMVKKISISEAKVDKFVEKILKDQDINIGYFPDFVERKIYKNVFTILVNVLDEIDDTTSMTLN